MEVRETGACGISEKEYAIDLAGREIEQLMKVLRVAAGQQGDYEQQLAAELAEGLEERKMEATLTLDLKEGRMHQVCKMVQAAQGSGDPRVDGPFVEELTAYLQHVVGEVS